MNRTALAAPLIVAALALAGCSTTGPAAETTPSTAQAAANTSATVPTAMPSTSATASSAGDTLTTAEKLSGLHLEEKKTTAWTKQIRDQFMESYDRTDVSQFSDGTPHQKISGWYETEPGTLLVEVKGNDWIPARLRWLATEIMDRATPDDHRLGEVTVSSADHQTFRTVHDGDRVQ